MEFKVFVGLGLLLFSCCNLELSHAACDHILLHGFAIYDTINVMLGRYYKAGIYNSRPFWKMDNPDHFIWNYYDTYWIANMELGSLSVWFFCMPTTGQYNNPEDCPVWLEAAEFTTLPQLKLECEDSDSVSYYLQEGFCQGTESNIEELVVLGPETTQPECEIICNSDVRCEEYITNRDGCFPRNATCAAPWTGYLYKGFTYTRGLLYDTVVGASAHQSSTDPQWEGSADRAVDGNLNNRMVEEPYCSHTTKETQPWWAVEIVPPRIIRGIWIKNRADCCGDRLKDLVLLIGNNGSYADNEANLNARIFNEILCATVPSIEPGARSKHTCLQPSLGNYVVITFQSTTVDTILTLCEVEIMGDLAGQYMYFDTAVAPGPDMAATDAYCASRFEGYTAHIEDETEWESVKAFTQSAAASGDVTDACLAPNRRGARIANKLDSSPSDFTDPLYFNGSTLNPFNVASESFDAFCSSSSELSAGFICEQGIDHDQSTSWSSNSEGVGAWIKIDFRYEYPVLRVALMQRFCSSCSFKDVSLDFSGGESINMALAQRMGANENDPLGKAWDILDFENPILASHVTIMASSVYTSGNNGFNEVEVWAHEQFGWNLRDGRCDGDDLVTYYGDAVECQNECRKTTGCMGFVYYWQGASIDTCYLKTAVCDDLDIIVDPDATMISLTTENGFQVRHGDCHGNDIKSLTFTNPAECYDACADIPSCQLFNTNFDNMKCWLKYKPCQDTKWNGVQRMIIWTMSTPRADRPGILTENYIGCYRYAELAVEVQPVVASNVECNDLCNSLGYAYSATWDSTRCRCGNQFGVWGKFSGANGWCITPCASSPEMCGLTTFASSVYSTDVPVRQCTQVNYDPNTGQELVMSSSSCDEKMCILCERNYDKCSSNPCQNDATCMSLAYGFNCTCIPGFEGDLCELEIMECDSNPCVNGGTCIDEMDAFTCDCIPGFLGTLCEIDFDECSSTPCQNGGTCNQDVNSYSCTCFAGYTGVNCQTNINECAGYPCLNGGTCADGINVFLCVCLPGFEGVYCEENTDECASNPCQQSAPCLDLVNAYECDCPSGYGGANCDTDVNECSSSPCENGGTCTDVLDGYGCQCQLGFEGPNCEYEIDECGSGPCTNHIECIDLINDFECDCIPGFQGKNCEFFVGNPGIWTSWGNWTACSETCGQGTKYRTRECEAEFPDLGVGNCQGDPSSSISCYMEDCPPVDGKWGPWKPVSSCSTTCGPGTAVMKRHCEAPAPNYGGSNCTGIGERFSLCQNEPCKTFRNCNSWADWTDCLLTCGQESQTRFRYCYSDKAGMTDSVKNATSTNNTTHSERIKEVAQRSCGHPACNNQASSCQKCDVTVDANSRVVPECPAGSPTCDASDSFCSTTFSAIGSNLKLEKGCTTKTECEANLESQESSTCKKLTSMASAFGFSYAGVSEMTEEEASSLLSQDLFDKWSRLGDLTCSVCCQGDMCNEGMLPRAESILQASEAVSLKAGMLLITVSVLYSV